MKKVVGKKEVDDVKEYCDGCEREFGSRIPDPLVELQASSEVVFNFGYYSDGQDGDNYEFKLCQECSNKLLSFMQQYFEPLSKVKVKNHLE